MTSVIAFIVGYASRRYRHFFAICIAISALTLMASYVTLPKSMPLYPTVELTEEIYSHRDIYIRRTATFHARNRLIQQNDHRKSYLPSTFLINGTRHVILLNLSSNKNDSITLLLRNFSLYNYMSNISYANSHTFQIVNLTCLREMCNGRIDRIKRNFICKKLYEALQFTTTVKVSQWILNTVVSNFTACVEELYLRIADKTEIDNLARAKHIWQNDINQMTEDGLGRTFRVNGKIRRKIHQQTGATSVMEGDNGNVKRNYRGSVRNAFSVDRYGGVAGIAPSLMVKSGMAVNGDGRWKNWPLVAVGERKSALSAAMGSDGGAYKVASELTSGFIIRRALDDDSEDHLVRGVTERLANRGVDGRYDAMNKIVRERKQSNTRLRDDRNKSLYKQGNTSLQDDRNKSLNRQSDTSLQDDRNKSLYKQGNMRLRDDRNKSLYKQGNMSLRNDRNKSLYKQGNMSLRNDRNKSLHKEINTSVPATVRESLDKQKTSSLHSDANKSIYNGKSKSLHGKMNKSLRKPVNLSQVNEIQKHFYTQRRQNLQREIGKSLHNQSNKGPHNNRVKKLWNDKSVYNRETVNPSDNKKDNLDIPQRQFDIGRTSTAENRPLSKLPRGKDTQIVKKHICNTCMIYNYTFMINPFKICKDQSRIKLLILVLSSPEKLTSRNAIRMTWGERCRRRASDVKCAFVVGRSTSVRDDEVLNEAKETNDVLLLDIADSYRNLTYKTVMAVKWAVRYCSQARYIMKTDDDVYVNTNQLPLLLDLVPARRFYGGFCVRHNTPHRNKDSKWYMPVEEYAQDTYPHMCTGPGYMMSRDVAASLSTNFTNIPFVYLEDVYVALTMQHIGVKPHSLIGFSNYKTRFDECHYRYFVMTSHGFSPKELIKVWQQASQCQF